MDPSGLPNAPREGTAIGAAGMSEQAANIAQDIGHTMGRYTIVDVLGAGGMGVVYEGIDSEGRRAAIKVLRSPVTSPSLHSDRFAREARSLSALKHPGIVTAFESGTTADQRPYLVMERLVGFTLQHRLDSGQAIPLVEALAVARQVAEALEAVHAAGIIHRDLKPSNIFLVEGSSSRVKLLDFGLAKPMMGPDETPSWNTRSGALLGTPLYMSPEQCHGQADIDQRTDIYSLGCVLYALLCGGPPFMYGGPGVVIAAQLHESPRRPSTRGVPLSPALDEFVLTLLAKDPAQRPFAMRDVICRLEDPALLLPGKVTPEGAALGATLSGSIASSLVCPPRRHRWQRLAGIGLLLVLLTGAGALALRARITPSALSLAESRGVPRRGQWLGPELVRNHEEQSLYPEVAIDGQGASFVVWREWENDISHIWARRHDPAHGWGAPIRMDVYSTEAKSGQVRTIPAGGAIASWRQITGNGLHLWARIFSPQAAGSGWSDAFAIDEGPGDVNERHWTLRDDGNGVFAFAKGHHLYVRTFSLAGGFGPLVPIVETAQNMSGVHVAQADDGWVFLMYRVGNENAIHFGKYPTRLRYVLSPSQFELPVRQFGSLDFRLGADDQGRALAVIVESDRKLTVVHYAPEGGWRTEKVDVLSSGSIGLTDLSVNASGQAAFVWEQEDAGRRHTWIAHLSTRRPGARVEPLSPGLATVAALRPWVSLGGDGQIMAVWHTGDDALWARHRGVGGQWDAPVRLSEPAVPSITQYRVTWGKGEAGVTWDQPAANHGSNIWIATFDPQVAALPMGKSSGGVRVSAPDR